MGDYVADSKTALALDGSIDETRTTENTVPAWSWQHGLAKVLDAVARAGLAIERVREYPHANGCRVNPALVPGPNRTWVWPDGVARLPLMYGLRATRR